MARLLFESARLYALESPHCFSRALFGKLHAFQTTPGAAGGMYVPATTAARVAAVADGCTDLLRRAAHHPVALNQYITAARFAASTASKQQHCNFASAAAVATKEYDVVVVGSGPGGYVAAIKAGQMGLSTACIDKREGLGGTCLHVGCIPSKTLLNISSKYVEARNEFTALGICGFDGNAHVDVDRMQRHKQKTVQGLSQGIEFLFKKNKVQRYVGEGKFADPHTIEVTNLQDSSKTRIRAKNIILATGSEPSEMPGNVVAIDERVVVSSTGALNFSEVPRRLVVIGGGVIGLELGSLWRNLGAEVCIVEFFERLLPPVDGEVARSFRKVLEKTGITIHTSTKVTAVHVHDDIATLRLEPKEGEAYEVEADKVLVAVGRRPYTTNLGLEELGIEKDRMGRVVVNDDFSVPNYSHIRAIGDCIRGPMLAHKASEEGIACVELIANKGSAHVNYSTIPSVVYTHPEIAGVGKTEEELKESGVKYAKGKFLFAGNSRARCVDQTEGFVKVLTDKDTDRILGAWLMGPDAGELVAQLCLGLENGAAAEDLGRLCVAHPTLSEAVKEACMACYDKPIHAA